MDKLKIIIVDDVEMTRLGLYLLLDKSNKFSAIVDATDGGSFLDLLQHFTPDMVLMDVNMPIMNGIEATQKAMKMYPSLKIIALTNDGGEEYIEDMIAAGAKGFLMKKINSLELQKVIEVVMNGGTYFAPELISYYNRVCIDHSEKRRIELTAGEETVLNLLCKGFSIKEIASKLSVSIKFVDEQCSQLSAKTATHNAVGLVLFAIKHKMVTV